ncbi:hypothetical protein D9Q98_000144 [Chlorella vulgaris]|uniref:Ribosome biogenesis protein SLX9 n=1 Tax=Chlorella vulgaris TaxID=3077 RepID=A0A9D4Z1C9_CHLVU|nr:hypothetical protein D9Q98_000144 [Chlorella vulgaris]
MVKRAKLAAKKARKLLEGEKDAVPAAAQSDGPRPAPHIQRKLTRKVKFLERVAATKLSTSKGGVSKKKQKKAPSLALTNLASLTASLAEVAAEDDAEGPGRRQFGRSVGTQKGRARVAEVESLRHQQVMQHPQFQLNPIAAIASHLAATLPPAPPPSARQQAKDPAQLRREKKKRRKERAAGGALAMGED